MPHRNPDTVLRLVNEARDSARSNGHFWDLEEAYVFLRLVAPTIDMSSGDELERQVRAAMLRLPKSLVLHPRLWLADGSGNEAGRHPDWFYPREQGGGAA